MENRIALFWYVRKRSKVLDKVDFDRNNHLRNKNVKKSIEKIQFLLYKKRKENETGLCNKWISG